MTIAPSASPRGVVHQTVTGEVRKVDRNRGEVTVRTADGKDAKFVLPPGRRRSDLRAARL